MAARKLSLSTLVLASLGVGLVFGIVLNLYFPAYIQPVDHYLLAPLGKAFLRLIQFIVVPIVFSSLILGLTRIRHATQVGQYLIKLLTCYLLSSAIATALGMVTALLLQPGTGIKSSLITELGQLPPRQSLLDWLIGLIPVNPLEALSTGNLLQTIFSAVLISVGIQLAKEKAQIFVEFIESIYFISEKILFVILYVAPVGVFALISSTIATQGYQLISNLFFYVCEYFAAAIVMISLYVASLAICQIDLKLFFQSFAPALSFAFGTASSNASLPIVLQNAQDYRLREDLAGFALPLGSALKHDGSAILQGFNALFIAQIYHVPITADLLWAIALSTLLVSFSTPGIPGSAIINMTTVLSAAGLPLEGIAIVAGVDRLMDGLKTGLNVLGNISNAIFLSRWQPDDAPTAAPTPDPPAAIADQQPQ